ncbi:FmdB family zinc ribbon protein [Legionella sp. W05-934-2]|uniref:FmdB family zinc ribbon protein n=1 Tax=Legionella sp. W05-934-2 TaxID=1198649 RepID=UPI003461A837
MPIYEYECKKCHHQFDLMQKMSDEPVKQCPKCFQLSVVRMVSAAGFQLKGSGWYQTDFKEKPKKASEKTDANASTTASAEQPAQKSGQTTQKKGDDN